MSYYYDCYMSVLLAKHCICLIPLTLPLS